MEPFQYQAYTSLLNRELVSALGCTEPIAVAFAAARARELLGEDALAMELGCSGNIIKNVMGVVVPNSGGMKGADAAAVLGMLTGDSSRGLEVLQGVTPGMPERVKELLGGGFCSLSLVPGVENLFIDVRLSSSSHTARVVIRDRHSNIVRMEKDGEVLLDKPREEGFSGACGDPEKALLNVKDILIYADTVDLAEIREVIGRQVLQNCAISDEGLSHHYGADVGQTLLKVYGDDVKVRARARAAAGSDARMGGCSLPVVINSGSGNQGMTVSLPVIEFARELGASEERLFRSLAVSNLVAIHQKKYIGSLSAYCGAVSAACGAGAGITYLCGGGYEEVCATITNTIANVGGIVCDGAKPSCAAKIASAVDAAIMAHYMGRSHKTFAPGDGLVQEDVEGTIESIGRVGREGMRSTDEEILNIMIGR